MWWRKLLCWIGWHHWVEIEDETPQGVYCYKICFYCHTHKTYNTKGR